MLPKCLFFTQKLWINCEVLFLKRMFLFVSGWAQYLLQWLLAWKGLYICIIQVLVLPSFRNHLTTGGAPVVGQVIWVAFHCV